MRTETYTVTVVVFNFTLDASRFVAPNWSRIVCVPEPGKDPQTYRQTLEEYTQSQNWFKSIYMTKQVLWDFAPLKASLEYAIRQTGYPHRVFVSFPLKADKIRASSSHIAGRISRDKCARICCVISCLCIIFGPIYLLSRKQTSNK
jgi:hypothetical protein